MNRQFLLAACLATALPGVAQAADVMVHGAFARATPPGAQVGGVFFEMMNRGEDARLVGGQTDVAADVQIHTHSMDSNGIMRMRELEDGLPVPAGETVVLQPGGLHVMLIGLTQRLAEGETLALTLEFADGTRLPVAVPVARISAQGAGAGHGGHQGHDMKAMDHGTGQAKTKHAH